MRLATRRYVLALIVPIFVVAACDAAATPSPPTQSSPPATSEEATFELKQVGLDGQEVTVLIFDPTQSLAAARVAKEEDELPVIPSEVEPRIGAVPGDASQLRVLWGGGVCDTAYAVTIDPNTQGGYHIVLQRGPLSDPSCDTLGIRRGVVLTFKSPVDARTMSGALR